MTIGLSEYGSRIAGKLAAVLWLLAASLLFSVVFASGKLAGGAVPALQIVFIRYASGLVSVAGLSLTRTGGLRACLAGDRYLLHALRAICGLSGLGCTVYAGMEMLLADAAALKLLQGVFTILLAIMLLSERVTRWQIIATLFSLIGALVIVRGETMSLDMAAISGAGFAPLIAILGAVLLAGEVILIKALSRTESALSMLFSVNGMAVLFLLVPMIWLWQPVPLPQLALLCLLGPMAIIGQICNIRSYRLADAAWLVPFGYSSVAFAALIDWIVFADLPGPATWLGTALIIAGGLVLIRRQ